MYLVVGMFVNIRMKNLSGKEAIPNIDFWRSFPSLVQEGIILTINTVKNGINIIKSKIYGNKQEYNEF